MHAIQVLLVEGQSLAEQLAALLLAELLYSLELHVGLHVVPRLLPLPLRLLSEQPRLHLSQVKQNSVVLPRGVGRRLCFPAGDGEEQTGAGYFGIVLQCGGREIVSGVSEVEGDLEVAVDQVVPFVVIGVYLFCAVVVEEVEVGEAEQPGLIVEHVQSSHPDQQHCRRRHLLADPPLVIDRRVLHVPLQRGQHLLTANHRSSRAVNHVDLKLQRPHRGGQSAESSERYGEFDFGVGGGGGEGGVRLVLVEVALIEVLDPVPVELLCLDPHQHLLPVPPRRTSRVPALIAVRLIAVRLLAQVCALERGLGGQRRKRGLFLGEQHVCEFDDDFLLSPAPDAVHVGGRGEGEVVVVEAERERALADLSEMGDFEAVPGVDGGLVGQFFCVLLHEGDPQVDVAVIGVVNALQVLAHLEGLVEVDAALLVPPVAHHWVVRVSVVLGSKPIVVLCGENTARLARSLLQQNQLHRKRTVVVVVPHRLHSYAVALDSRCFRRQPLDGGRNFVEGGRMVVGIAVEELVGDIFEGGIASGVLEVGPRVIDGFALDDVDALAEHLLAVVVEPLQIGLFGLSHLPLQLELPLHLFEPHHLNLVLELLPHARHLLELLQLHLIQLALLGNLRQKVQRVVLLRHQRFDEDVLIALPPRVQTLKQSLLIPRES